MPDSPPDMARTCNNAACRQNGLSLPMAGGGCLVHSTSEGEGKTWQMAKGLFLCIGGRLCAGESAGLGLPVWKMGHRTYFPTLMGARSIGETTIEKAFRLDRTVVWCRPGQRSPAWVSLAMEYLVNIYMNMPLLQHGLLKLRDIACARLALSSTMESGPDRGECRVTYTAARHGLTVHVDGSSLQGQGQLVMLNEVDGTMFNSMRAGNQAVSARDIPAWKETPPGAWLESRALNVKLSVDPPVDDNPASCRVFHGREVARGLDWAGLALMHAHKEFTYHVNFARIDECSGSRTNTR